MEQVEEGRKGATGEVEDIYLLPAGYLKRSKLLPSVKGSV